MRTLYSQSTFLADSGFLMFSVFFPSTFQAACTSCPVGRKLDFVNIFKVFLFTAHIRRMGKVLFSLLCVCPHPGGTLVPGSFPGLWSHVLFWGVPQSWLVGILQLGVSQSWPWGTQDRGILPSYDRTGVPAGQDSTGVQPQPGQN